MVTQSATPYVQQKANVGTLRLRPGVTVVELSDFLSGLRTGKFKDEGYNPIIWGDFMSQEIDGNLIVAWRGIGIGFSDSESGQLLSIKRPMPAVITCVIVTSDHYASLEIGKAFMKELMDAIRDRFA